MTQCQFTKTVAKNKTKKKQCKTRQKNWPKQLTLDLIEANIQNEVNWLKKKKLYYALLKFLFSKNVCFKK